MSDQLSHKYLLYLRDMMKTTHNMCRRYLILLYLCIVLELLQSKTSERQGRAIDTDSSSSMEIKKIDGYF